MTALTALTALSALSALTVLSARLAGRIDPEHQWYSRASGAKFRPRGRSASTGSLKGLLRAQVQVPGKTAWTFLTANSELALAA
jgi:hypothetical protein